jgi:transposase
VAAGLPGGDVALAPKRQGGYACKLDQTQLAQVRAALGPAAYGWDHDQWSTVARITALIARLFHVPYTLRGVSYLLHRMGSTPQIRCTGPLSGTRTRSRPGGP